MGIHIFKYHDKDYDGIVLKINSGWLATNPEFNEALKEFQEKLKKCQYSSMMPDHTKNMSELDNWKEKSSDIRQEKKDWEEAREKEVRRRERLLKAEVIEIEYQDYYLYQSRDGATITLNGKSWTEREQSTRKSGLKAQFKREFEDELATKDTWEEFSEFLKDNGFITPPRFSPESMINWKGGKMIATGAWKMPTVKISIPYLRVYELTKRNKDLVYRRNQLEYHEDVGYFMAGRTHPSIEGTHMTLKGSTGTFTLLKDYELINNIKFEKRNNE